MPKAEPIAARTVERAGPMVAHGSRSAAFDQACSMEDRLDAVRDFAGALCGVAETLDDDDGLIVLRLAGAIRTLAHELDNTHRYFFRLHHPHREQFEREGWPA